MILKTKFMGLIITKIIHPTKKEVRARIKKIFKFEYPKTFNVNKSLLFLIFNINHILDKKIMKGKNFIIILGIKMLVNINGVNKLTSRFLKNSISSNKFKIIPKQ